MGEMDAFYPKFQAALYYNKFYRNTAPTGRFWMQLIIYTTSRYSCQSNTSFQVYPDPANEIVLDWCNKSHS